MKRIILISILFWAANHATAQTNYFHGKTKVSTSNISYNIESTDEYYIIYKDTNTNAKTPFEDSGIKNWYGRQQQAYEIWAYGHYPAILKAMKEVFTKDEISKIRATNEKIAMSFAYDKTGSIKELSFAFPDNPIFYSIPPEKWLAWEEKIKEYLHFKIAFEMEEDETVVDGLYFYLWKVK